MKRDVFRHFYLNAIHILEAQIDIQNLANTFLMGILKYATLLRFVFGICKGFDVIRHSLSKIITNEKLHNE